MEKKNNTEKKKVLLHEIRLIIATCILVTIGYFCVTAISDYMTQKNLDGIRDAIIFEL